MNPIEIIWEDEYFIAVYKPVGLPVHKNKFLPHDAAYLTKLVGEQLGQSIYNVHRLDAKTSGLMLLAKSSEAANKLTTAFERHEVGKTYKAIVKGNPGNGSFDRQVVNRKKKGKRVDAFTSFKTIQTVKTQISYKEFENIELSLLDLQPTTGRWHQLRQHCGQQRHDIIGDTQHGDWTLNRIITEITGLQRLMLHASTLQFSHPYTDVIKSFERAIPKEFVDLLQADLVYKEDQPN